jgi:hypothetical protein
VVSIANKQNWYLFFPPFFVFPELMLAVNNDKKGRQGQGDLMSLRKNVAQPIKMNTQLLP